MPEKTNTEIAANTGSVQQKDVTEEYDGSHGKYKDDVADDTNTDSKLPTTSFPKAPDPSPFKLGPMSPGGR
jgi:hypothetical protein